jgi:gliding motility-associated protein GldM
MDTIKDKKLSKSKIRFVIAKPMFLKDKHKSIFMKTIILSIALLFSFQLYSQTENKVVISADKMNVLYIGIDNPISIAVSGIASDKLLISISNGTLTGSNGKYIVKVDHGPITLISVATEINGEIKNIGNDTFRIKRVPDPSPSIGNYYGSNLYLTKEEIVKDPEITVSLCLPFDLEFKIISFTFINNVTASEVWKQVTGNKFTEEIITLINGMKAGDKFFLEDIKAKCPDGTTRSLTPIIVNLIEKQ